jgi:hypothetical protein
MGGFKPGLPHWMGRTIVPGEQSRAAEGVLRNRIRDGGVTPYDNANPHLSPRYPISAGKRLGYGQYGGDFLAHLARLQDPVANRAFLQWMMEHHYRRPN